MPIVDKFYVPKDATIECLKKRNFTREHIWKVVKNFRVNFRGKEYKNIEQKFKDVMGKEYATNAPLKPDDSKEIIKKRKKALENRSKDGIKKAQQAKHPPTDLMSQTEVEAFYNKRNN